LDGPASFGDCCRMIVGRAEELAQLERLLADLRAGRGRTLAHQPTAEPPDPGR